MQKKNKTKISSKKLNMKKKNSSLKPLIISVAIKRPSFVVFRLKKITKFIITTFVYSYYMINWAVRSNMQKKTTPLKLISMLIVEFLTRNILERYKIRTKTCVYNCSLRKFIECLMLIRMQVQKHFNKIYIS